MSAELDFKTYLQKLKDRLDNHASEFAILKEKHGSDTRLPSNSSHKVSSNLSAPQRASSSRSSVFSKRTSLKPLPYDIPIIQKLRLRSLIKRGAGDFIRLTEHQNNVSLLETWFFQLHSICSSLPIHCSSSNTISVANLSQKTTLVSYLHPLTNAPHLLRFHSLVSGTLVVISIHPIDPDTALQTEPESYNFSTFPFIDGASEAFQTWHQSSLNQYQKSRIAPSLPKFLKEWIMSGASSDQTRV